MPTPIDPRWYYGEARKKFENSPLNGWVPKDGSAFGITTGSPDEWARFSTMLMRQESGLRQGDRASDGSVKRFATTPAGEQSYGPLQFKPGEYGLRGWDDVNDPLRSTDALIEVAKKFGQGSGYIRGPNNSGVNAYFGSIRRPHEWGQHSGWFSKLGLGGDNAGGSAVRPDDEYETVVPNAARSALDARDLLRPDTNYDAERAAMEAGFENARGYYTKPELTLADKIRVLGNSIGGAVGYAQGNRDFGRQALAGSDAILSGHSKALQGYQSKMAELGLSEANAGLDLTLKQQAAMRDLRNRARAQAGDYLTLNPGDYEGAAKILAQAGDTAAAEQLAAMGKNFASEALPPQSPDELLSASAGVESPGGLVDRSLVAPAAPQGDGTAPAAQPAAAVPQYVQEAMAIRDKYSKALPGLTGAAAREDAEAKIKSANETIRDYQKEANKDSFARQKDARELARSYSEERSRLETSLSTTDRGIALADRMITENPDGTITLNPDVASQTGLWGQYTPNISLSARMGEAAITELQGFTRADALVQLKAEAGGIGSVTEREWDTMAARISGLNSTTLRTDPQRVASVIYDFRELMKRQRQGKLDAFAGKYGVEPQDRTSGDDAPKDRTSAPTVDDGVVRSPKEKRAIVKQQISDLPVGGEMVLPSGRKIRKTGPGPDDFEQFFDPDPNLTEEGFSP